MKKLLAVIALLTILVIGLVGCGNSKSQTGQEPVPPTKEEVVSFVNRAVEYARENGREKALAEFTDQSGEFVQGELYIYAYDYSGTVLAHGGNPSLVGQNLYNMEDANGVKVIQELINLARQGGGWLSYLWDNPTTQKNEPKLGYAIGVDDTWWLGSGTYPQK